MGLKIKRRKGNEIIVPTSSMGDIAFLLIIFFMLTSKFMQEAQVEHVLPNSPEVEQILPQELSLILDENGVLWVQGEETDIQSMAEIVKQMQSDLDEAQRKEFTVVFKVHNELDSRVYEPVIRKLAELDVNVAFAGEKDK